MSLQLDSLAQAIDALGRSVKIATNLDTSDDDLRETVRAGVIHNFEVSYELCWKMMKRWLVENIGKTYVDGITRRDLFRLASEHRLIADPERWMDYHFGRNDTSHTYNEDAAQSVFEDATEFIHDAKQFFMTLEARND